MNISCFLLLFVELFLGLNEAFAADIVQHFKIHNYKLNKCLKAELPRSIVLDICSDKTDREDIYRWHWTKNGQIQNVQTKLCVEINDYEEKDLDTFNLRLKLGVCNYRKILQKWRCEHRYARHYKYFYLNPAHFRIQSRWKAAEGLLFVNKKRATIPTYPPVAIPPYPPLFLNPYHDLISSSLWHHGPGGKQYDWSDNPNFISPRVKLTVKPRVQPTVKPKITSYSWHYSVFNDGTRAEEENMASGKIPGANICDFDHRDHCLQTVATLPSPSEDVCFVAVSSTKRNILGYGKISVLGRKPLRDFTISIWVKTGVVEDKAVFSYVVGNVLVLGFGHFISKNVCEIYLLGEKITSRSSLKHVHFAQTYWTHIALVRSVLARTLAFYVNGDLIHLQKKVSTKPIPGEGVLLLGKLDVKRARLHFNGLISQFNVFSTALDHLEIENFVQKQHCCNVDLVQGDWLGWTFMMNAWTLIGTFRVDRGAECTSFEKMPKLWTQFELSRQTCRIMLMVSDPRYTPDYRFSSSSWVPSGKASSGRADRNIPGAWCPEKDDKRSYLQVDLSYIQRVTAIGTMTKLRGRHASRFQVYHSKSGIHWDTDEHVYEASRGLVPNLKIVALVAPIMTRYLRLYPVAGCALSSSCCLAIEVYGCDPVIDKKIAEPEDGCTSTDKPYILMSLSVERHITRIQLRARQKKNPIQAFTMQYMAWRQWIPYQVNGRTKLFEGSRDATEEFTHILAVPIYTRLIKIFPIPDGSHVCGDFTFIGCYPSHEDLCSVDEVKNYQDCKPRPIPQCSLGFLGNGHICQDVNECDVTNGAYCDRNSVCRNKHGSFSCDSCKNNFIGDGRICQTSCEAFNITCGPNSFCDFDECKCNEGFIRNGTVCVDDSQEEEEAPIIGPNEIDGLCPDGFFNCYGDVIGTLEALRRAALAFENYEHDDCSG